MQKKRYEEYESDGFVLVFFSRICFFFFVPEPPSAQLKPERNRYIPFQHEIEAADTVLQLFRQRKLMN